jgi:RNA polymerase sigma factor (sigma-70 family)
LVEQPRDDELWCQIRGGDEAAFGALYERHANAIYNFCFRRSANWARAEDMVAEVFLLAWRKRGEVEITTETGESLPWLYGVALNVARNAARSDRRAARAVARIDAGAAEPDFSPEVVERLADEEQMAGVLDLMELLPQQEQDALAVCVWAGLTYDEAAIALAVPVGTVRSRLSRARAHLRELLEANGHELGDERVARADH